MAELGWFWRIPLTMMVALLLVAHGVPSDPAQGNKVLVEKVRQLMDWTKKSGAITMSNTTMFHRFVLEPPINYSMMVMFTVLHELRQCVMCKHAAKEFQILANSWQHCRTFSNKVFFAMVDYDTSPEAFQTIRVVSVPNFLHFSAKGKFTSDDVYNFEERGIIAEQMAKWVAERTNIHIRIRRPMNDHHLFLLGTILMLSSGLVYLLKRKGEFIFDKTLWAILAVSLVAVMTSGQMWTHINRAPYAQRSPRTGHVHYIHRMADSQFVAETYIVALFHVGVSLGMVFLDKAATSRMNVVKRKTLCVIGMCLVVILFSWLLSLFRFKERAYPYSFLMD
ncbi:magnesium transporter protein 1-like [Orycteropus afer afer]|uniref:Magnesium transporter protein 1-like n=1 Tax=Orycteropus afer afer TaxID=1230840 RepID=A0AC54ZCN8_ORYAF|nr:magnesium transporter protein 1-like [Orycteropus afer afer]